MKKLLFTMALAFVVAGAQAHVCGARQNLAHE